MPIPTYVTNSTPVKQIQAWLRYLGVLNVAQTEHTASAQLLQLVASRSYIEVISAAATLVAGDRKAVNTTSAAVTVTLPLTPNIGDFVELSDAAATWDTNNLTVARNGSPIDSAASDLVLSAENARVILQYINSTIGWKSYYTAAATGSTSITGTLAVSGASTLAGVTATTLTATGATALGATAITAATPSLTTSAGQTNTGFVSVLGKTSGGLKRTVADASAFLVTETLAAQTSGTAALTIPDFAGVADEYTFKTKAQTMSNKTFVAPVLGAATGTSLALTGALSSSSGAIASAVTNYTADGAITLTSGVHTIAKTSAAAMTVAAPSSVNGTRMTIVSNTDFAHVITFTGATLLDGTTGANLTVTMTALKGSAITVIAVGTIWLLESSSNVTSITV